MVWEVGLVTVWCVPTGYGLLDDREILNGLRAGLVLLGFVALSIFLREIEHNLTSIRHKLLLLAMG